MSVYCCMEFFWCLWSLPSCSSVPRAVLLISCIWVWKETILFWGILYGARIWHNWVLSGHLKQYKEFGVGKEENYPLTKIQRGRGIRVSEMEGEAACRKDVLFKAFFFFFLKNKIINYIQSTCIKTQSPSCISENIQRVPRNSTCCAVGSISWRQGILELMDFK